MFAVREPVGAGMFYNVDKDLLLKEVDAAFKSPSGPKKIDSEDFIAAIVPHDKLHLSGSVAAWAYAKMEKANYVIIGPNHNSIGSRFAVMRDGMWKNPLGGISIDSKVAQKIIDKTKLVTYDVLAHKDEHAIEVQLPFLQYKFGNDFKMVPLNITNSTADLDFVRACVLIGKTIGQILNSDKEDWIIIGTTDFTSGAKDLVERLDKSLLKAILTLKPEKIFETMNETNSNVCGYGALLTTIAAAREGGARRAKLLKYATSYDVTQDPTSVTGYASIIIY